MWMSLEVSLAVSAVAYILMRWRNIDITPRRLAVVSFWSVYSLAVVSAISYDIYLDYRLSTFDLDGDGIFSGPKENTPEQAKVMAAWTNDLGRNLVPFTGFVWSLAYALFLYLGMASWRWVLSRFLSDDGRIGS